MFVHKPIPNDDRPNIIFIITDQQRYDTIAGLGYEYMDTPNLDRLVREGVSFDQCHVTAASCACGTPVCSRAITLTPQAFSRTLTRGVAAGFNI